MRNELLSKKINIIYKKLKIFRHSCESFQKKYTKSKRRKSQRETEIKYNLKKLRIKYPQNLLN